MAASTDKKKRKRRRLKGIEAFELAFVPRGANGLQRFPVLKEDSMKIDVAKLTEAHARLGKIVTVCKSGQLSESALATVTNDLNEVEAVIAGLNADGGGKTSALDKAAMTERLAGIRESADKLHGGSLDLNLRDDLDKLIEQVGTLQGQVEALPEPAAVAPAPVAAAPVPAPAATTEPAATEPAAAAAPATEPAAAPAAAAPAATEPAAAAAPATEPAAAPATEPAAEPAAAATGDETETVTKADLAAFGQSMGEAFSAALGKFGEQITTTLKSGTPAAPAQVPTFAPPAAVSTDPPAAPASNGASAASGADWGNAFDLNSD
jgi:hypothetical protein